MKLLSLILFSGRNFSWVTATTKTVWLAHCHTSFISGVVHYWIIFWSVISNLCIQRVSKVSFDSQATAGNAMSLRPFKSFRESIHVQGVWEEERNWFAMDMLRHWIMIKMEDRSSGNNVYLSCCKNERDVEWNCPIVRNGISQTFPRFLTSIFPKKCRKMWIWLTNQLTYRQAKELSNKIMFLIPECKFWLNMLICLMTINRQKVREYRDK